MVSKSYKYFFIVDHPWGAVLEEFSTRSMFDAIGSDDPSINKNFESKDISEMNSSGAIRAGALGAVSVFLADATSVIRKATIKKLIEQEAFADIKKYVTTSQGALIKINCQIYNVVNENTVNSITPENAYVVKSCPASGDFRELYNKQRFIDKHTSSLVSKPLPGYHWITLYVWVEKTND